MNQQINLTTKAVENQITIKDLQVKRINIEAGIEVVIEEVSGRINMRAGVSRQLEN